MAEETLIFQVLKPCRQQAQEALWRVHEELESRVQERTKVLVDSNERLRELSHRLMNVQETERRQIAHDLHDEIGQSLTAMKLNLREANDVLTSDPAASLLTDSLNILDQVIGQVGLLGMEERARLMGGEMTITSSSETGTRLTASLPLVDLSAQAVTSERMT